MNKSDIYLDLEPGDWDVHRGGRAPDYDQPVDAGVDDSEFALHGDFPDFPDDTEHHASLWKLEGTSSSLPEQNSPSPPVPRGNKGLKKLSIAVKALVTKHGALTYKGVADRLISTMEDTEAEKEEKNIRRRVYDALNVLIAADVLTKQGKEVRLKQSSKAPDESDETQKRLLAKQKQLRCVTDQYRALNALMHRNQRSHAKTRIGLPFVVMATRKSPHEQASSI